MRITVRAFASLREAAGQAQFYLDLPSEATVADAWASLCIQAAGLAAFRSRVLIALNRHYMGFDAPLAEGDELALFPPVSGG